METHEHKTPIRDVALRAIAVLGLIAVLLLGAWGIIQLAVAVPTLFSNFGGFNSAPQKETLVVSSIANISSGQTLQVSWDHKNSDGEYSYTLSYACQNGLSVKAPLPTGSYQAVPCNTPFNFVNANKQMTLIPTATVSAPLTLTVSATKLSNGAVTAQGIATTNVAASTVVKTPVKTTTSSNTTYVPAASYQTLYGNGDLSVSINSITPSANDLTSVKFTVANVGTNVVASGWAFNANLPINGSYMFMSQPQRSLNPGDKIVYTLSYSNTNGYNSGYNNSYSYGTTYNTGYSNDPIDGYSYTGAGYYTGAGSYNCNGYTVCYQNQPSYNYGYSNGPVTITVDPQNSVWESNESNNVARSY